MRLARQTERDSHDGRYDPPLTAEFIASLRSRLLPYPSHEQFVDVVGRRDNGLLVGELDALCEMAERLLDMMNDETAAAVKGGET